MCQHVLCQAVAPSLTQRSSWQYFHEWTGADSASCQRFRDPQRVGRLTPGTAARRRSTACNDACAPVPDDSVRFRTPCPHPAASYRQAPHISEGDFSMADRRVVVAKRGQRTQHFDTRRVFRHQIWVCWRCRFGFSASLLPMTIKILQRS